MLFRRHTAEALFIAVTFAMSPLAISSAAPVAKNILSTDFLGPPPLGFNNWRAVFEEQQRLNRSASRILQDADAKSQLAGIIADPQAHKLQVFWKGEISESTDALLGELRTRVAIDVVTARFSEHELLTAAHKLVHKRNVLRVSPNIEGSGLEVVLAKDAFNTQKSDLERFANIPLTYSFGRPAEVAYSRGADSPPYYSGSQIYVLWAYMRGPDYLPAPCSMGFGAIRLSKLGSIPGFLTAAHCDGDGTLNTKVYAGLGNTDFVQDRGVQIGTIINTTDVQSWLDVAFVTATDPVAVGTSMYIGRPFNDPVSVPVGSSGANFVGNYVFTSGASTGLNGALKITRVGVTTDGISQLIEAQHIDPNASAVGDGDSGGPVFALMPDGRAQARGIISRLNFLTGREVTCPSQNRATRCANSVLYADIQQIENTFDLKVATGSW